ncbi:hypothetical protein J2S14_003254 [Lederbergia wuyishanensis]|uniref:Uncharacterized protein n=1 Tax=Lederbergia wuyishanensis TaxID=1347903 RepID=A0ABU0D7U4_9BACI|nr:hypothetical protein [Lederbergia wuyishanensis]
MKSFVITIIDDVDIFDSRWVIVDQDKKEVEANLIEAKE